MVKPKGHYNMQKDNRFFEDLARLATGAAGNFMDAKREMDAWMHTQFEKFMAGMHFVTREEFDAVAGMLAKAREEQEDLKKRLQKLEKSSK